MIKGEVLRETEHYELVLTTAEDTDKDMPATFYGLFNKTYGVMEHADVILPSAISWLENLQKQTDILDGKEDDGGLEVELPTIRIEH